MQPLEATAAKRKPAGKVSFYKGTVQRSRSKKGPWKKLKRGKSFYKGDYIRTKTKSRVELRFRDRSVVRLGPKTTLQLKEASFAGKQKKKVSGLVKAGRAWANVHKYVSGKAAFDLRTENVMVGVRGTVRWRRVPRELRLCVGGSGCCEQLALRPGDAEPHGDTCSPSDV